MSRIGCWRPISSLITRRWPGSGAVIRTRSRGCSGRCWLVCEGRVGRRGCGRDRRHQDRRRTRRSSPTATVSSWPRPILDEAEQPDAAEDELFGDRRGDELPARVGRRPGPAGPDPRGAGGTGPAERPRLRHTDGRAGRKEQATGRKLTGPKPSPDAARRAAPRRANTTDPHSRIIATGSQGRAAGLQRPGRSHRRPDRGRGRGHRHHQRPAALRADGHGRDREPRRRRPRRRRRGVRGRRRLLDRRQRHHRRRRATC